MTDSSSNTSTPIVNGGLGFVGALTITFIVLKLIHQIEWSWWWVISPCWISAALIVLAIVGAVVAAVIAARREERQRVE